MRSPLAIREKNIEQEPADNGGVKSGIPAGGQNEPRLNGIVKSPIPAATVEIGQIVPAASSALSIDMP